MPHQVTLLNISLRKGLKPNKWFAFKKNESDKQARLHIGQLIPEAEVKDLTGIVSSENILSTFSNFNWAVSIIAFIVAILGIANIMITSVLEQTREIGVLLAIGWKKSRIVSLILYESTLLGLMGGVTYDCQCNCTHCSAHSYKEKVTRDNNQLTIPELKEVVKQAIDVGSTCIVFTGGEPLLINGIFDLIRTVDKRKAVCTIFTNGELLNKKSVEKLKKAGFFGVFVSLDFADSDRHNNNRQVEFGA